MIRQVSTGTVFSDATTHVGRAGQFFFDPVSASLRCSDGATPGGVIIGGAVLQVRVALTSAQLLNCQSNPVPILPAPAPNQMYVVNDAYYSLTFGTTAYGGDGSGLWYGGSVSADGTGFGVFNGSASQVQQSIGWSAYNEQPYPSLCVGIGLFLWSPNSQLSGGDGTGSITVNYSLITP